MHGSGGGASIAARVIMFEQLHASIRTPKWRFLNRGAVWQIKGGPEEIAWLTKECLYGFSRSWKELKGLAAHQNSVSGPGCSRLSCE